MSAYHAALDALRACEEGLAGHPTPAERAELLQLMRDTLALLEGSARQRLTTAALARRVQALELQLRDRDPAERRTIICERLGISRSRYFELRSPEIVGLPRGAI